MIAENIDKVTGRAVPTYHLACADHPSVCAEMLGGDVPPGGQPAFGVWADGHVTPYSGAKSPEKLVAWLGETVRAADASAAAMARAERELYDAFIAAGAAEEEAAPRGEWRQLPSRLSTSSA